MAGLVGYGCTGALIINTVPMNCPSWDITNLTPLWAEFTVRGDDRRIPGVAGVIPYKRRMDVTEHALEMVIIGGADRTGASNANPWVGLENNIAYLRTNVVDPTMTGNGTRAATLVLPSGATRFANIHVLSLRLSEVQGVDDQAFVLAALQISIPLGVFV